METSSGFESWAIVELMGHVTLAGLVKEEEIASSKLLRIDIPECGDEPAHTRFFGAGAIYCMTPVTEEVARAVLARNRSKPAFAYGLPRQLGTSVDAEEVSTVDDDDEIEEGGYKGAPRW